MWQEAFTATFLISIIPIVSLQLIPVSFVTKSNASEQRIVVLNILLSFAAGGLLGDVFLHAIPHLISAEEGHTHEMKDHSHDTEGHMHGHGDHNHEGHNHGQSLMIGLCLIAGFFIFIVIERVGTVRRLAQEPNLHISDAIHNDVDVVNKHNRTESDKLTRRYVHSNSNSTQNLEELDVNTSVNVAHAQQHLSLWASLMNMKTSGWLNLLVDTLHNVTDGIAIGTAYASGTYYVTYALSINLLIELLQ